MRMRKKMKALIILPIVFGLQSCVSHKMVEEDPLDFSEPGMKMIASVKEVPREERKRGFLSNRGGRRNVAGMSYFITQDEIKGTMRFQYTGENGSVFHDTTQVKRKVVKRKARRKTARKPARNYNKEILAELVKNNAEMVKGNAKLDRIETITQTMKTREPTSSDDYTPPQPISVEPGVVSAEELR